MRAVLLLPLLLAGCAGGRPSAAVPPGTGAGRQTESASCSLGSLTGEDWLVLRDLTPAVTRRTAAQLSEPNARQLCLSRRLLRLVDGAADREAFAAELVPEDVPYDLERYLNGAELERVRPVVARLRSHQR